MLVLYDRKTGNLLPEIWNCPPEIENWSQHLCPSLQRHLQEKRKQTPGAKMTQVEVQEALVPVKSSGRGSLLEMWVFFFILFMWLLNHCLGCKLWIYNCQTNHFHAAFICSLTFAVIIDCLLSCIRYHNSTLHINTPELRKD